MRATHHTPEPPPAPSFSPARYRSVPPPAARAASSVFDAPLECLPAAAHPAIATIERYLTLRATRLGERTIEAYRRDLLRFAAAVAIDAGAQGSGPALLRAVTPEQVAEYLRARFREPGRPEDRRA